MFRRTLKQFKSIGLLHDIAHASVVLYCTDCLLAQKTEQSADSATPSTDCDASSTPGVQVSLI